MMLERELRRLGLPHIDMDELARSLNFRVDDDLFVAIGCGDMSLSQVIKNLSDVDKSRHDPLLELHPTTQEVVTDNSAVSVLGLKNILTTFARCCKPAPGDEIVGYITRGRGATIHRNDCPNILRQKEHERIVKVTWGEPQHTYPVEIQIKAYDRQGLMGDISNILNNENINVKDIKLTVTHNLATIMLVLEIMDIVQLSRVLTRIESLPNIMEAHRMKPG